MGAAGINSRRRLLQFALASPALALASASPADPLEIAQAKLRPLFKHLGPTYPGDWLAEHRESGQTYREFRAAMRTRAIDNFKTIRVVPIGPLTAGQKAVLDITVEFMRPFFGLPLVLDPVVRLESIPNDAQRVLHDIGPRQLLTSYLLNTVLTSRRHDEDAAVLGIAAIDLWPGPGWNFVFGQASLTERVGVWSMARNGNADGSASEQKICTTRTVMTATHETGHMFGIRHCIAWKCGMNGSNSLEERDHQPLEFCPECQPKLWWTLGLDPLIRSRALEVIAQRHGLEPVAADLAAQSRALAAT
jgi:archaemetzincin